MSASRILRVAELDFHVEPRVWDFAETRADEIDAHWRKRQAAQPSLFNGRVLLLGRHELTERPDGRRAIRGAYFETDFKNFLAWRDFGFPGSVCNGFSMAALRGSDGAFVLGEMGVHTSTAGQIYFAAGTPDRKDVFGDRVDLLASLTRELEEETGVSSDETLFDNDWIVVYAPPRIACMKIMRLAMTADEARARIEAFLAREEEPELSRIWVAREIGDLPEAQTPMFVQDFLQFVLS